eukprot:18484-Eustigmatos_ZCMA.PRE.1
MRKGAPFRGFCLCGVIVMSDEMSTAQCLRHVALNMKEGRWFGREQHGGGGVVLWRADTTFLSTAPVT